MRHTYYTGSLAVLVEPTRENCAASWLLPRGRRMCHGGTGLARPQTSYQNCTARDPPPCFASRSVASWSMVNARVMDLTVYHHGGESRASLTPAPWQHGWLPCAVAGGRTANQCQHAVRPPTGPIENVCMHKDAAARVFFRISVCGLKYQVPYRTVVVRSRNRTAILSLIYQFTAQWLRSFGYIFAHNLYTTFIHLKLVNLIELLS